MTQEKREVRLNLLRGAKGKKQSDIAEALNRLGRNVNQQQVSAWEKGLRTPTIEVAIDMAVAYEVTLLELIEALGFDLNKKDKVPQIENSKVMQT
jgi:transcriptional regulator with XRE-family HTH domain